jgi:hypothetical protein
MYVAPLTPPDSHAVTSPSPVADDPSVIPAGTMMLWDDIVSPG